MFVRWTAETTGFTTLPLSSETIRWGWRREEGPRTQGAELQHLLLKNRREHVCQSVHLQWMSRAVLVFLREVSVECVCRFQTSVLLNHVCIVPQRVRLL